MKVGLVHCPEGKEIFLVTFLDYELQVGGGHHPIYILILYPRCPGTWTMV